MVFLSDALKVKLGYDLSTSSTRNQFLHFFIKCCLKCRFQLNPVDHLLDRGETGLASPSWSLPCLFTSLLTSLFWPVKVPVSASCGLMLWKLIQVEPKGDQTAIRRCWLLYWANQLLQRQCLWDCTLNQKCMCLLIFLRAFPLNTAFLFDFCQGKKPDVFPTAKL